MNITETKRIAALRQFDSFEFDLHKGLEDILELAASICQTPVAFITLIDEEQQWFKVCRGFQITTAPRATSFCNYAIAQMDVMVVPDTIADERFGKNPFIADPLNIRFYAGAPLTTLDGSNIGTLCVYDAVAKELPQDKQRLLGMLAKQVIHLMELDLSIHLLNTRKAQITLQNEVLMSIAFTQSHEFRRPLANIMGIMNLVREDDYITTREYMEHMETAVTELDEKVRMVVRSTEVAMSVVLS